METTGRKHYPDIVETDVPVMTPANQAGPPPDRDGAALWLKLRTHLRNEEDE